MSSYTLLLKLTFRPPGTGEIELTMTLLKNQLSKRPGGRVLICAPSNSATDKLCERALQLFPPELVPPELFPFQKYRHVVVRTGAEYKFAGSVKGAALSAISRANSTVEQLESMIGRALADLDAGVLSEPDFESRVHKLVRELAEARRDRSVEEVRSDILQNADFVFTTMSSAANERLRHIAFDLVIIHKANAACEARTLLALRRARRYVLFGDQKQLQPFVTDANKFTGYNRSFFERLVDNGYPLLTLNVQGEYHPDIYLHVSSKVYSKQVQNGGDYEVLPLWSWQVTAPVFYPNTILNVPGSEQDVGTSSVNYDEINAVVAVVLVIMRSSSCDKVAVHRGLTVGVLSPYAPQAQALEAALNAVPQPDHVTLR